MRRTMVQPKGVDIQLPAPVGGLNANASGTAMAPTDCYALYNMTPAELGLRVRLGAREHASQIGGAIVSLLPFTGTTAAGSRIFATTSAGIFDITTPTEATPLQAWTPGEPGVVPTDIFSNGGNNYVCTTGGTTAASGDGPTGNGTGIVDGTVIWDYLPPSATQVLTFASASGNAGRGVCHVHVTSAGHFLLYWDEVNGLHVYTESTGLWAAVALGAGATQIAGVNPANLVHGTIFKGRVWHVERDSARLWYMETGSLYGTAQQFSQATKLKAGGSLRGVWNWTYDGGSGLDDRLVTASDGGDVAIWEGTDPSSASLFGMTGVWQVGALPAGRDIATDRGGELLLLTRLGILPLSKLVLGKSIEAQEYETAKISNLFNALMSSRASSLGWSMRLHPEDNTLVVTVPDPGGTGLTQLVMSMSYRSWSLYRDLEMSCTASYSGKLYFGDPDGSVWINEGTVDGVELGATSDYTAIQYAGLSSFQSLGSPRQKQVHIIRPLFAGQSAAPDFDVDARFDLDATELGTVLFTGGDPGGWDSGVWDTAIWGGEYSPTMDVRGAVGMGVNVAIAWRGASVDRTVLASFDIRYEEGGLL